MPFVTSLKWRETTRAQSQGTREIVPHRAHTLSVIEIFHKPPHRQRFGCLSSVSATSHGSSQRMKLDRPLLQRVVATCCHQPSYTIFPRPVRIVNRTCHTFGPGKACLKLAISIFGWTTSRTFDWLNYCPTPYNCARTREEQHNS